MVKIKKRKKASRMRGRNTYGHGSRKKWRSSGEKGGHGMSGTGKRADHKKTLITKLYGNKYFGKQGITSRKTQKKKIKWINLRDIEKKQGKEFNLKGYKILGDGELTKAITIAADSFTLSAKSKIEKAGGKAVVLNKKDTEREIKKGKEEKGKDKEEKQKPKNGI